MRAPIIVAASVWVATNFGIALMGGSRSRRVSLVSTIPIVVLLIIVSVSEVGHLPRISFPIRVTGWILAVIFAAFVISPIPGSARFRRLAEADPLGAWSLWLGLVLSASGVATMAASWDWGFALLGVGASLGRLGGFLVADRRAPPAPI